MRTSLELYAPVFNQAVALNAKSLIILMVLPFALLLPLVFFRNRQPFMAHVVFSLHLYAFLLLLFCVSLGIAAVDVLFGGALALALTVSGIVLGYRFVLFLITLYGTS